MDLNIGQKILLTNQYGVRIRYNTNYYPQANPTERFNKTLKMMLAMYVSDNHRTWDVNLVKVACATCTAVHEATNHTPYYVNFERNMILNGNEFEKKRNPENEDISTQEMDRKDVFKEIFVEVRKRLDLAARKSEKMYNLRRRHEEFTVNQPVWRKNLPSRTLLIIFQIN